MEKIGHVIHPTTKLHPALEHNLMLPEGYICAINSDLKSVFNTYSSMYAAALALGLPSYRKIRRYIGQNFLVSTDKGSFFFDASKETLKNILNRKPHEAKTIEAYNLISKQIFTFSSVNKASKNLGIHHDFINKHLSRNTIYFGEDGRQFKFKYIPK